MNSLSQSIGTSAASPNWRLGTFGFLLVAAAIFAVPGLIQLAEVVWTTEQGAHGPIILCTGIWLLIREARPAIAEAHAGHRGLVTVWLLTSLVGYVLSSILGIVSLLWASTYSAMIAILYAYVGRRVIARLWFPLFYLAFVVPPPYSFILALTRALKLWIAGASVDVLSALGYSVASSGTTLYIDQYELLVAAACSGMNSLVSLMAIGLFYIYLRHQNEWRYAALLGALVIPIAIAANLIRVIILLLVTKYLGNETAQGLIHEAAGLTMFVVALILLMGCDVALTPLRNRLSRTAIT